MFPFGPILPPRRFDRGAELFQAPAVRGWRTFRRELLRRSACRFGVHRIVRVRQPYTGRVDWRCRWCGRTFWVCGGRSPRWILAVGETLRQRTPPRRRPAVRAPAGRRRTDGPSANIGVRAVNPEEPPGKFDGPAPRGPGRTPGTGT